jgi:hypothetical protein
MTCSGFVTMPALPTLSCACGNYLLRIAGSAGDGITKIQWSQIQATFQVALPSPPVSPPTKTGTTGTTSFTVTITTPIALATGTTIITKFFWQAWSYTG